MKLLIAVLIFIPFVEQIDAKVLYSKKLKSIEQKRIQELLSNIFYDELYKKIQFLKPEIEVRRAKISIHNGLIGKSLLEIIKQKNREQLARNYGFDPANVKSGKDLIKLQQNDNKFILKKMAQKEAELQKKYAKLPALIRKQAIWKEQAELERNILRKRVLFKHRQWRKKFSKTLKYWKAKNKDYTKDIIQYKKTEYIVPIIKPVAKKELQKKVRQQIFKESFFISSSLKLKIKDQSRRATCSSFTGIRAIEILLAQNGYPLDLSEQYLYWASKPSCQYSPCHQKGSWIGRGFMTSQKATSLDIPIERNCPYQQNMIVGNETQIPLSRGCYKGVVKINKYKLLKNLDQVMDSLRDDLSVLASITLTPNFYENQGLILEKESYLKGKMNEHSKGHSVLFIGYLKLPKILNEGKVCFITANSWGIGWGHGGYSCISEKWIMKHRSKNPFVVLDSIII